MARRDPHSYTDVTQAWVNHLDLFLDVDFESKVLKGRAKLALREVKKRSLDLDTRGLTIEKVTQNGENLRWELAEEEGFMGAKLTLDLKDPEQKGETHVVVHYHTSPEGSGLQWLEPELTAGKKKPYMFTQCQPIHARSLVPIQDSPRVRFSYDAHMTLPAGLSAVMSAAPGSRKQEDGSSKATFRFSMPQPIPAYLLALAVGNIAKEDLSPRSRVYAEPEVLKAAAWEFAHVDKMLTAAEELFGPYLWDRFDFLVMPPSFPYGGMENPRLTFLTPTLLAGDRSLVNVLAHELAHSWTGNLVTNATMNDFWLNEGFTVWAERRILEKIEGEELVALEAAIGRNSLEEEIRRFGKDSPLTHLETDLSETDPDSVYSVVPYEKGFLFVALMERTVGRKAFDGFLRDYIERFKFTSLATGEFESYLKERLPQIYTELNVDEWIHGPGVPKNAPVFHSEKLKSLEELGAKINEGVRPDQEKAESWDVASWLVYLEALPKALDSETCEWLDETFNLTASGNSEILCDWLEIAIRSGYKPAFPKVREFLGEVGRMKFLKPLYKALAEKPSTAKIAEELFQKNALRYHPIARAALERVLENT